MTSKSTSSRIFGLDLMRAVAILLVLCSHILWIYPPNNSLFSQFFQLFGFLGVEIFFVLSGFLIGTIFYKQFLRDDFNIFSVFYFLKRRWFRTLPNYYLFFIINLFIGVLIGYPMPSLWKYVFFLQNAYTTMMAFYPESWSLAIEEYTYIIFPFSLFISTFFLNRKSKKRTFIVVVLTIIIIFFFNKVYYNCTTKNTSLMQWNISFKNVVLYRVDAILYGVVFSWIAINYNKFWKKYKNEMAVFAFMFIGLMYFGMGYLHMSIEDYPTFWNVFYLPITSFNMALFLPFLSQWKTTTLPFKNIVVTISLISYSYYLIHYGIVLQLMKYYVNTEFLQMYQLHLYTFVFLVVSWSLSYLNYKYFEKPMMDLRDKF